MHTGGDFWKSLRAARGKSASAGVLRRGRPVTIRIADVPEDAGFLIHDRAELQRQIAAAQGDAEKVRREIDTPQFRRQMEEVRRQAQAAARAWSRQAGQLRQEQRQWQ